ncbi:MAG: motility associated factor glycosyltransferase family protein [Spirochaetia bacterium]|nr:motility associated factor glycosyltransferase family protein [Spirochaetia bacterium]
MKKKEHILFEAQKSFVQGLIPAPDQRVSVQVTPNGPVLFWQGSALQSVRNAQLEAERRAAELRLSETIIFFGAAAGTTIRLVLERGASRVIWFEPLGGILHAALSVTDLSQWLSNGSLIIFCGKPSQEDIARILEGSRNAETLFVPHRSSYRISSAYEEIQRSCERILNRREVNMATLARFDRTWTRNLYENFSFLPGARPVSRLFGLAQGGSAVIVGAGPSLYDSLDDIRAASEHALLIAVDTSLLILQHAGIDPDIVFTVDPQPLNRAYLEGYTGRALFVVDPTTSFHSLRLLHPDSTFFTWSPFPLARLFLERLQEDPGEISFGGSVSTNAYDLAVRMGCSRIHLVGQDLSFPGGLAHSKGAILEERLNTKECRIFRREMHNYRQMSALPVRYLPGLDNQPVPTNDKLLIFHNWFSSRIPADMERGITVVNSTVRGAKIPPLPRAGLKEIPSSPRIQEIRRKLGEAAHAPMRFDRKSLMQALEDLRGKLQAGAGILRRSVETSQELLDALSHPDRTGSEKTQSRAARALDELDAELRADADTAEIIGNTTQAAIFRITDDWGGQTADESANLRNARKAHRLYQEMEAAAVLQIRWIEKAIRGMKRQTR